MSGAEFVLAQVAQAFPGASAFLFEPGPLASALQSHGLETIVSGNGGGLSAIKRDKSLVRALPAAGRLAALAREIAGAARSHDVLYANSQKAFILTALAATFVRRPLVWHLHDILDPEHFGGMQRRLQIGLANRVATRVVVPSTACAEAFVQAGGRRDIVTIVPNGVAPPPPAPRPTRASLGLPDGPLVGVFSRLAHWKGQHVLLQALQETPEVGAIIVGSALFQEEAYERRLRGMVDELGLDGRVMFLGQRNDVPQLMAAVDCVVHSSTLAEPFGLTLVEAMMAGTSVVATDAGAAREILDDGRAGQLVQPGDASSLAAALKSYFAAPQEFARQRDYAAERAAENYTADRMRRDIRALVEQIAAERAK
jgi:glycosyltransferase involved in cell wall biosynthesis